MQRVRIYRPALQQLDVVLFPAAEEVVRRGRSRREGGADTVGDRHPPDATSGARGATLAARNNAGPVASSAVSATVPRRLNFGCGYDRRDGYLNVDSDPACAPDLLLVDNDLSAIPRDHFDEVLALDVLEHIPRIATSSVILEWADMLAIGGELRVETSSIEGIAERMAANPKFADHHGWSVCLFGNQVHAGDFHHNGFTERTLRVHLLAAGLEVDEIWVDQHWLLNARATKRASWTESLVGAERLKPQQFIERIYAAAFGRSPDPGSAFVTAEMAAGRLDHRGALKLLMASPERLFTTAVAHDL